MKYFKALFSVKPALPLWLALTVLVACKPFENDLRNGMWRATLKTDSDVEIPFNFTVSDSSGKKRIHIINAKERIQVDEIRTLDDSVWIRLPFFDSEIAAKYTRKGLQGRWIKHLADKNVEMPFAAEHGISWRFFKIKEDSSYKVGGRWSVLFLDEDGKDTTLAVGEFNQNKMKVTGTFLTTTGDYRFLEGNLSNNVLSLSTFDGSNALLFTAKLASDSTIIEGKFFSGKSSVGTWTAKKDDKAMLPDAYSLTSLKKGRNLNFAFPSLGGETVSLNDERFDNKVVILQFLGTWCPNCLDETRYLTSLYKNYKNRGLEVVGLAYERTTDVSKVRTNLERFKSRLNVEYPLLMTGYTNKEVLESMPALSDFKAFPTTILVDKNGVVRKIHTGFNGPGTGKHYTDFITEFEEQIRLLLDEK